MRPNSKHPKAEEIQPINKPERHLLQFPGLINSSGTIRLATPKTIPEVYKVSLPTQKQRRSGLGGVRTEGRCGGELGEKEGDEAVAGI